MTFAELICRVAAAKFRDSARLGVRLSPVNIDGEEAEALVVAGRAILPPGTYIAVAAPGARAREDERTCISTGDRAAELATHWRNTLVGNERILYVSARRLGRAGGLQDTLVELTDAVLRVGLLSWCESEGILPKVLTEGLRTAGVLERADARSLCRFVAAASGQPVSAIGALLPMLDLAADSRLDAGLAERLRANARWVKSAATGDNRGIARMDAKTVWVRQELAAAISGDAAASADRLHAVDLGVLSNEELASDTPKTTRSPRQKREPEPTPGKRLVAPGKTRSRAPVARPVRPVAPVEQEPGDDAQDGEPGGGEPVEPDAGESVEPDAGEPVEPDAGESVRLGEEPTAPSSPGSAEGDTPSPRVRQSGQRPRSRGLAGPWTTLMHQEERGTPAPLPDGVVRLVGAVLDGDGAGLIWCVAGAPGSALRGLPKILRDPDRQAEAALDASLLAEWRAVRAELIAALGGAAALPALSQAPYSMLGDDKLAGPVASLVEASQYLLEAAAGGGAVGLQQALSLDTATLTSTTGERLVLLAPTHPLVLGSLAARLPGMARAAALKGPARSMLAEQIDRPLVLPARLPYPGGDLPWTPSPMVTPIYGELSVDDPALCGAVSEVCAGLCRLQPHARLGLTVAAAEGGSSVAQGVAQALSLDEDMARATVYCAENVILNDAGEALVQSGRLRLEPLDAGVRPHLWVRSSGEGEPAFVASTGHALGLQWRNAEQGGIDLAAAQPPRDAATWTLVSGSSLRGAPPRPAFVLSRGASSGSVFAVISGDPRGAARALTPTYKALGVERLTPKTIENLTRDLATGAAGLVSLGPSPDGRIASLLIELVVADALGEDAVVAGLMGVPLRVLLGVPTGAFCLGATLTSTGVRLAFGVGLITREPGAGEIAALERGLEVVRLANKGGEVGSAAREVLARAVGAGWRRGEQAGGVEEALLGARSLTAEVFLLGEAAGTVEVAGAQTAVRVVTPALLERLVMGMRGA